ncbi:DUF4169 family protein [Hyphomicrobium sp. D-2]|uniref:DUF4169 family protein n=1 Tax=Hyphomicrobium sp. D-2 TaxID=3041621 RepID=UPI0024537C24|nr:DUF4169 family protein [Hyphomicrobium sp. D-2]MDH4983877.1 DUF4169 family protein [Hyphomicrobium sp. D-2]
MIAAAVKPEAIVTAEIINLRRARKAKNRRDAEARAEENRIAFGRTKAERQATDAANALEARKLDGLLLERNSSNADDSPERDAPAPEQPTPDDDPANGPSQ